MAIQEFEPNRMTDDEIDRAVQAALASHGRSARDFEHASQHYNSDFFRDEPEEFKRRMCVALHSAFQPRQNPFWQKVAGGAA
jgi:hypothetical protein